MWDLIVLIPDYCLSIYFSHVPHLNLGKIFQNLFNIELNSAINFTLRFLFL